MLPVHEGSNPPSQRSTTVGDSDDSWPLREVSTMRPTLDAARRRLPLVHFVVDSAIWALAIPLAVWLRYDYDFDQLGGNVVVPVAIAVGLQGLFGLALRALSSPVALRQLRRGARRRADRRVGRPRADGTAVGASRRAPIGAGAGDGVEPARADLGAVDVAAQERAGAAPERRPPGAARRGRRRRGCRADPAHVAVVVRLEVHRGGPARRRPRQAQPAPVGCPGRGQGGGSRRRRRAVTTPTRCSSPCRAPTVRSSVGWPRWPTR